MMFPLTAAPGLNTDDTSFVVHPGSNSPGYIDMDKARFWRGLPQTIGGWEGFVSTALTGVCRNLHPWDDLTGALNVAFGTHSNLALVLGGVPYDITPTLALPAAQLVNPILTSNGSTTVVVAQPGHPYIVGDIIVITNATAVATVTINGTWTVSAANSAGWSFVAGSAASATASGGGTLTVTPQRAFAAGAIDGTGGQGFGTGTYSTGGYSQPSTADYFPRTWSLANFGQTLIANPRNGTIHQWNNVTGTPAGPILNAPAQVAFALVTPQRQIVAFGCNQAINGVYSPMNVRGCDLEAPTTWFPTSTNNAWEQHLEGGGRLVGARMVGDLIFVWSDTCLWQAQFIGDPGQTYRFTRLGDGCGLIGPNAAAVIGQSAFWMSPDGNFHSCALNGEPQLLISAAQTPVFNNLAASQQDKINASEIPKFGEVWWFYPDYRDGNEVSRYIGLSLQGGTWLHGTFDRTAFHKGAPAAYPIGVSAAGNVYYHEKGQSADGAAFSWFWETGGQYLGNADQRFQIKRVWPDFQSQVGPVSLSIYMRAYPQDTDRLKGPFALAPGQSKRDFLSDGRIARVRVAGNSVPTFCRQGRLQFEGEGTGMQ